MWETKLFAFSMASASFIFLMYLWISLIVKIHKAHKENGDSIKECISYINSECFIVIILLSLLFIISLFGIRAAGTEYLKTAVCNVEINNDNTLYKYKVTKYDEIEYRIKRLNGEWKEGSQTIKKTKPEIIYIDDISEYNSNIKQKEN